MNYTEHSDKITIYIYFTFLIVTIYYIYYFITKFEKEIKVRKIYLFGEQKFSSNMISDYDSNIYKISNQPLLLSFDSAEILSNLYINKNYKIKGFGVRIPFLGLYKHIIQIQPLDN
jgi:hypothetical protein